MVRRMSALGLGLLLVSACASAGGAGGAGVGATTTTSGRLHAQCLEESDSCASSADCCSDWCVNGVCERQEP